MDHCRSSEDAKSSQEGSRDLFKSDPTMRVVRPATYAELAETWTNYAANFPPDLEEEEALQVKLTLERFAAARTQLLFNETKPGATEVSSNRASEEAVAEIGPEEDEAKKDGDEFCQVL